MEQLRHDVATGFARVEASIRDLATSAVPREVFEARLQIHLDRIKAVEADVGGIKSDRRFTVTTWLAGFGAFGAVGSVVIALVLR
jgi:hypothetical protein